MSSLSNTDCGDQDGDPRKGDPRIVPFAQAARFEWMFAIVVNMGAKAQFLRDLRKRVSAQDMEVQRRAFLFVARNATLPAQVRHKAQLGLNALNGGEGRMGAVKNRCVETGRGRGESLEVLVQKVLTVQVSWVNLVSAAYAFRSKPPILTMQYQFRLRALAGELTGVQKSSW